MNALKAWIPALCLLAAAPSWAARQSSKVAIGLDQMVDYESAFHKVAGPRSCGTETALYVQNSDEGRLQSLTLEGLIDVTGIDGDAYFDDASESTKQGLRSGDSMLIVNESIKKGRSKKSSSYKIRLFRTSKVHRIEVEHSWQAKGSLCRGDSCRGVVRCAYEYEL